MSGEEIMSGASRRQVQVTNLLGLHLRAASRFVRVSERFQATVRVSCNGCAANGQSVLDLLMLAAGRGARLDLEATGADAEAAATALCALIEAGFDEDDDGRENCSRP